MYTILWSVIDFEMCLTKSYVYNLSLTYKHRNSLRTKWAYITAKTLYAFYSGILLPRVFKQLTTSYV